MIIYLVKRKKMGVTNANGYTLEYKKVLFGRLDDAASVTLNDAVSV